MQGKGAIRPAFDQTHWLEVMSKTMGPYLVFMFVVVDFIVHLPWLKKYPLNLIIAFKQGLPISNTKIRPGRKKRAGIRRSCMVGGFFWGVPEAYRSWFIIAIMPP
jgi:hypothetical protein